MDNNNFLIVGLGNPGEQYENTRHNAGFISIDELQDSNLINATNWKQSKPLKGFLSEARYKNKRIFLLKPQTFMNLSGQSTALVAGYYKIPIKNIIVIYDDKDLSFGSFRIRDMGSSGGHNGIKSLHECFGSLEFIKFKIGIKSPIIEHMDTSRFVLGKLSSEEKEIIKSISQKNIIPAIFELLSHGVKSAQNKYNKQVKDPVRVMPKEVE